MRPFAPKPTFSVSRTIGDTLAATLAVFGASVLAAGGVLLTGSLARPAYAQSVTAPKAYAVPGEIVIWVPGGTSAAQVNDLAAAAGCEVVANLAKPSPYYLLRIKGTTRAAFTGAQKPRTRAVGRPNTNTDGLQEASEAVLGAVEKLKAGTPGLLADPNYIRQYHRQTGTTTAGVTPSDTYYPQQWDMRLINMPRAWQVQSSTKATVVAILDSGFDVNHPDFKRAGVNNFLPGINTTNPLNITSDVTDDAGHGTHDAGTIAAVTNNAIGISGIAGFNGNGVNIRLLPIKVGGLVGPSTDAEIVGITQAIALNASVINMSFGGPFASGVEQAAINSAFTAGITVVASAGNDGLPNTTFPNYPAQYPGVISVTAVDRNSRLTSYSSYGENVTIAAPGGDYDSSASDADSQITSTVPLGLTAGDFNALIADGYAYSVGTSSAAPHVSGAAALLAALGATRDEIRNTLIASATPLPQPGARNVLTGDIITAQQAYGAGLLNVGRALIPRLSLLGGVQQGDATVDGGMTSDAGSSYFRSPSFNVSLGGLGTLIREIGADPTQTALSFRIETATIPPTVVQNVTVPVASLPKLATGESPFITKAFALPLPSVRLSQGRYRATARLLYRSAVIEQVQFFEVQDYNQPTGLTLFSVPFQPTVAAGGVAEQAVLGISSGFALRRWDPLDVDGAGDSPYFLYQPGNNGREDGYARLANQFHTLDPNHKERTTPTPLAYITGAPTTSIAPIGVGFWLNTSEARTLETVGTAATNPVVIPLFGVEDDTGKPRGVSGWNLIGAPFAFPVNWSAVTVRQNTAVGVRDYSLQEAIDAEIINAQLVGWDVPTQSYSYAIAPGGQLLPFKAYWVRALRDCSIIVPPSRSNLVLTSRKVTLPTPASGDGWRVRVSASVAGDRDAQNFLGATRGAADGEDKFDVLKPPTGPGYADVRFLGTDRRGKPTAFAYDMHPLKTGKQAGEWTMAVGAGRGETDVTVAWDGLNALPARAKLTLKDTVTGRIVSMNGRSSYTYKNAEAGATRLFKVTLTQGNTAGPLQIRNVRTVDAGGGRGVLTRGVNVRFALSQDAEVSGTILSLSGKTIATLSGAGRAVSQGEVQLRWDGRTRSGSDVPPGTYLLELTARTDDGETTVVKKPITVLN